MWTFKKAQKLAAIEPTTKQLLSVAGIERHKHTIIEEPYADVLVKAREVLRYNPRDRRLNNTLAELDIETLDVVQVQAFMDSKNEGHGTGRKNFMAYKLAEYTYPIPVHVLNKAIQIKEKLPEAEFTVYHYEEGDPFLFVTLNGWGWYIEVWEEPTFEGRKEEQ